MKAMAPQKWEVVLNNAVPGGFTVTASTTNGTATAGEDYTETTYPKFSPLRVL